MLNETSEKNAAAYQDMLKAEKQLQQTNQELNATVTECESYLKSIDVIHKYSIEYKTDPRIIIAVMKLESNFQVDAKNGSYLGLMQINEDYFNNRMEALNFERNVECGASLLSGFQEQSSDLHYILNSYNMGKTGYKEYVAKTGEVSRSYSRKAIEIINQLKENQ
jgi:soluble lytic murein transglycosylase-like protein